MKRIISIGLMVAVFFAITACTVDITPSAASGENAPAPLWRCSVISYDNSFVIQYQYDSSGNVSEIIEYQNEGANPGETQSVSCNWITFDKNGDISSVKTSVNGFSTEVIDARTWRLYSDSYSLTVTYNDQFLCETQIIDLVDHVKITTKTKYDSNGKATSATTETEYYGENQKLQSTTDYEYEFDCNGNPVIQYSLTEEGKQITATYSWEC